VGSKQIYNWIPLSHLLVQASTLDNGSEIKIIQGVIIQCVVLIASSNIEKLLHKEPTSTVTSHDRPRTRGNYKRYTVVCTFRPLCVKVWNAEGTLIREHHEKLFFSGYGHGNKTIRLITCR